MSKFPQCALALVCATCAPDTPDEIARRHRDAGVTSTDAAATSTSTQTVSCYTEGAPASTCTLPVHCCFSNYSAEHDGYCTTSTCAWGTITCDGPEDCAAGQLCCAHAITDPNDGIISWTLACQSGACGAPALNEELCHGACTSGSCVSAYGINNDLPRTLSICR